ncbi:MAG: hypothetical protein QM756_36555 [Polyangiaceae bacterium]
MDEESLIEQLASAHRERSAHGEIRFAPAFYDLSDDAREQAFDVAVQGRTLEAALDPQGLSSTAHAVLARIAGLR